MRRINGVKVAAAVTYPVTPAAHTHAHTPAPACPKRCDIATPPEYAGGDSYVCICCGTQFTWKGGPP